MSNDHRQDAEVRAKLAEGLPEDMVFGLSPGQEHLVRARLRAAEKMPHLPPEVAYALTGGLPVFSTPERNLEAIRSLREAASPHKSKMTGAAYGLPAAAAGALLGHMLSGGDPAWTAGAGLAAGGAIGYGAHRGSLAAQRGRARRLAELSSQYQAVQDQIAQEQAAAYEAQMRAQQTQSRARGLRSKTGAAKPEFGRLFDLGAFKSKQRAAAVANSGGTGDSSLGPTTEGRGMLYEDWYNIGDLGKGAAATGNAMGVTGAPRPPSPSTAPGAPKPPSVMGAANAPRLVAPPQAPKPSANLSMPGAVTPNKNKAAGQPPVPATPLFGSQPAQAPGGF